MDCDTSKSLFSYQGHFVCIIAQQKCQSTRLLDAKFNRIEIRDNARPNKDSSFSVDQAGTLRSSAFFFFNFLPFLKLFPTQCRFSFAWSESECYFDENSQF